MWSHMTCGHVFYVSKCLASHFFKWTLKKKLDLGDRGVSPIFQILFLCINAIFEFKKIFSLRCFFFFQNLVASCACRSKGHCVAICPHCRRVVRTFLFLILFIYFPINGVERYNDAKTSLECGMNPQMHGTTPSLKRAGSIFTSQRLVFSWSLGAVFNFSHWSIYPTRNHCIFGPYYWWH